MTISFKVCRGILFSLVILITMIASALVAGGATAQAAKATPVHVHFDCSNTNFAARCTDVANSDDVFGHYVGHDEPSNLFYSNIAGSGNRNSWKLTLPRDPSANNPMAPGKSFNFELHITFWVGMAMCDTQSYPEQVSTCTPDSDKNIVDPTVSPKHAGAAFMEMQFYPPGWILNGAGASGTSCDPTRWCAALNVDSLSEDPVAGTVNNPACAAAAGLEYVNFAFITKNGVPQGPVSPLLANADTFTPNTNKDLMMNSGDTIVTTLHDTSQGLRIDLHDQATGQSGFMVSSAKNGFAQVKYDPTGTNCDPATHNLPYDFHPMYSTSSEKTNVPWAAHTYNIAFADEIGHFDFCNASTPITPGGNCPANSTEGQGPNTERTDADDVSCFPASSSSRIQVAGCNGANNGFDGQDYLPRWPDSNTTLHPTPIHFTSPLTGQNYNMNYNRYAFEADLPILENTCDVFSGNGCTLIPATDDCAQVNGTLTCVPAAFYPFFSTAQDQGHCIWRFGDHLLGSTNDFGRNAQYGTLFQSNFTAFGGGGASLSAFFNFHQGFSRNPCPS